MHPTLTSQAASDRVYQAIKARAIAYEFSQGERIYLDPIAAHLGVSTTPVREAMNRLAEKDLVIKAPRKGFIAMTLCEEDLIGHYELTRLLLTLGLGRLDATARRNLPKYEPIADVLSRLNRRFLNDVRTLATYTGEIFAHIADLTEKSPVVFAIDRANDHLYYIRTIECRHLDDAQSELVRFCELLLSDRCEELMAAIGAYHDLRIGLLPKLLDELRR